MKKQIARGAVWMVLFKTVDRSLGIVSTMILARLLVPADFGLVAMAMSVIGIIELAGAFSFEIALIQKAQPRREHYDTAWTLNILLGAGGALLIALLALPVASFYVEPRLTAVMLVLASAWLLAGFENVGTVEFRRQMDFAREFRFMAAKRLTGFVVTMALAWTLRSYWALVCGVVAGRVAGVLFSFGLHPYRPRFTLSASRELFNFSGWLLLNNVLGVMLNKVPHFFVGRLHGPQALGVYAIGAELAYTPATELIAPINRAVFPGYARLTERPEEFRATFVDVIAVIMLLAVPMSVGIAVVADPLVRVLLGENWLETVPIIQILAAAGAVAAVTSNNVSAYFALGRTSLPPLILVTRLAVMIPALFWLAPGGAIGVAQAQLMASLASLAVSFPALFRALGISWCRYFVQVWRPLAASMTMGITVHQLLAALAPSSGAIESLGRLISSVLVGLVVYSVTLWLLWLLCGRPRSAESILLARIPWPSLRKLLG